MFFNKWGNLASRSKLTLTALKRCIQNAQFVHSDLKVYALSSEHIHAEIVGEDGRIAAGSPI